MILTLPDLRARLRPGQRLLGLDPGSKTLGMAISDPGLSVATPIGTVRRTKFTEDAKALAKVVREWDIGGLVVGLPVNMDGSEGPSAQSARQLGASLMQRTDLFGCELDVAFWDERLSTSAVTRVMIEQADLSRKRRAKAVDTAAAAYILQGALDALGRQRPQPAADADDGSEPLP